MQSPVKRDSTTSDLFGIAVPVIHCDLRMQSMSIYLLAGKPTSFIAKFITGLKFETLHYNFSSTNWTTWWCVDRPYSNNIISSSTSSRNIERLQKVRIHTRDCCCTEAQMCDHTPVIVWPNDGRFAWVGASRRYRECNMPTLPRRAPVCPIR